MFGQRRGPQPSQPSQPTGSGRRGGSVPEASATAPTGRPRSRPGDDDDDYEDGDQDKIKFECPKQDGLYADPADCKKFYLCGSFHAYSQSCPPSLYFDDKLKFCTFKTAELKCGPVVEDADEKARQEASYNQDNFSPCDRSRCQLPNCYCSEDGTQIPGNHLADINYLSPSIIYH